MVALVAGAGAGSDGVAHGDGLDQRCRQHPGRWRSLVARTLVAGTGAEAGTDRPGGHAYVRPMRLEAGAAPGASAGRLAMTGDRSAYFAHDADVGVVGRGPTIEAAFVAAAEATFAIMGDLAEVRPVTAIHLSFAEADPELALVTWLNRLLAEARAHRLALARFEVTRQDGHWAGVAWGEPWRAELDRGVEVKGATLTMLAVRPTGDGWEARCVVDV